VQQVLAFSLVRKDDTATKKIENYLAGIVGSDRPTHTM